MELLGAWAPRFNEACTTKKIPFIIMGSIIHSIVQDYCYCWKRYENSVLFTCDKVTVFKEELLINYPFDWSCKDLNN